MFTAVLDTCVLWPSRQRDFFLSLAVEGLYRPVWSSVVLEELRYEQEAKLIRREVDAARAAERASYLVSRMEDQFEDALAHGWERLDGTFGLPDRNDEHVVASAVVGGAGAIVTLDEPHFPAHLMPWGVGVIVPTRFALTTVELDPRRGAAAVRSMARRSGRRGPAQTPHDVVDGLQRYYGMHEAAEVIRPHL